MKISPAGIALIKQFEGVKLAAYQDSAGVWTIGYGHTKAVKPGDVITQTQADAFLEDDIHEAETDLNLSLSKASFVATQGQFDALMSWVFNLGITNFNSSTAYRLMAEGAPHQEIAEALTWWNKAKDPKTGLKLPLAGLVRRRKAEADMFLGAEPEKPKPLIQTKTMIGAVGTVVLSSVTFLDQAVVLVPQMTDVVAVLKPYATTGSYLAMVCSALAIGTGLLSAYGRWKLRQEAQQKPEGQI